MKLNERFLARMREATQLLQTAGPAAATAAIQRALGAAATPGAAPDADTQADTGDTIALHDINPRPAASGTRARARPEVIDMPLTGAAGDAETDAGVDADADAPAPRRAGGTFLAASCTGRAGTRAYKLYVPASYRGEPLPLVVMLHGCKQNPDDFAAGTAMNALAEEQHCIVAYPAQARKANGSHCWNWFDGAHQARGHGEPAIIADIVREVMRSHRIDPGRIYIAGLSAGGAMAAIVGAAYPDLFAAVGVHSGLPVGAANGLPSALSAMKRGASAVPSSPATAADAPVPPMIVFHGDRDTTVHPRNGDHVLQQALGRDAAHAAETEQGKVPGGHSYTRTMQQDASGRIVAEHWLVHGAGHAWSGGSKQGSYTDPKGPDASREMLRFFYSHANPPTKRAS